MESNQENILPKGDPSLYFAPATLKHCLLNWVLPGAGYWLVGRKKAWAIMTGCLYVAFLMGIMLGGDLYGLTGEGKIRAIGSICQAGMGLPYILAKWLMARGTPLNPAYDYGTNYLLLAGMINWLAVMDIFDISVKRK